MLPGEPKGDSGAEREPDDPRRRKPQVLDERCGVRNVLVHADLLRGTIAITVTATVVGHHRKRFGQPGYDKVPVVVRSPSTMHTDERHLPVTAYLVEEPGPVDVANSHLLLSSDSSGRCSTLSAPARGPVPGRRAVRRRR